MITVVGFNTAIDHRIDLEALHPGAVQRAISAQSRPGGKGLHVAQTIVALGEQACLIGLSDNAHGDQLRDHMRVRGVEWQPVRGAHPLRQCLAIHEAGGQVTEILEPGATLDSAVRDALLAAVRSAIDRSSVLVCTGSLPPGFAPDTYAVLVHEARARGVRCLLDASADALREGVRAKPWLVKPNADEAASLLGRPVRGVNDAIECARQLYRDGVACAVVTLGGMGAIGFDGETLWHATSAPAKVRDGVGSGDCFLAGLAVGVARSQPLEVSLRRAAACGAANAENSEPGYAAPESVSKWLPCVAVDVLSTGG